MTRLAAVLPLLLALVPPLAMAQVEPAKPVFTAPMVHPPSSDRVVPIAPRDAPTPQALVRLFEQACVVTRGESGPAIDWALGQGFEPVDRLAGSAEGLLDGQPGTVLVAPGTEGRVMLAATGSQCSLWAELQEGPPLRTALAAMVGAQAAKGAKARVEVERNVERAGAWRGQVQWRFRAVGASQDVGVGAVTTLANGPGTQVLHVSPLVRAVDYAPDGLPVR